MGFTIESTDDGLPKHFLIYNMAPTSSDVMVSSPPRLYSSQSYWIDERGRWLSVPQCGALVEMRNASRVVVSRALWSVKDEGECNRHRTPRANSTCVEVKPSTGNEETGTDDDEKQSNSV